MSLKLEILLLSEKLKWKNWPTWLKGLFLFWPSLGPAYLFITGHPSPIGAEAELNAIMNNIEYQNYLITVFIGFWSINLILLGLTWTIGDLTSHTYRSYMREKAKKDISEPDKILPEKTRRSVKRYPVLAKKGSSGVVGKEKRTVSKKYPIFKKKRSADGRKE